MKSEDFDKLKIGSRVKLRDDLIEEISYGYNSVVYEMMCNVGKWVTVNAIFNHNQFGIMEGHYSYTIEMVEKINYFKYGK